MKLSVENYKKFYNTLNMISSLSADIQITDNKICQIGNGKSYLIYADLSSLLTDNDIDIYLYNIENKLPVLKLFNDTTSENIDFILDLDSKSYIISDGISDISIRYLAFSEGSSLYRPELFKSLDDSTKVLEFSLDKMLLKRLVASGKALDATTLNIDSSNGKGQLYFEEQSRNRKVTLLSNVDSTMSFHMAINYDCFKTAVGDSAKLKVYNIDKTYQYIVSIETEINGCYVEYRQKRKGQ